MDIIISVIIMFDEKFALIFHKNFLLTRRNPLIQRVSLLFMGRDPVELAKRAKYKPPAMRVRGVCYTKKSPFRYNEVVQANI